MSTWAAALLPALPPPPPQTVRTVAAGVGPLTLHSSSVQKNCRKSSVFLPWVLCALYQHYTGIFRYVPCLGCLVQLVLTAYLKTRPSMHWPMIIRRYNEILTTLQTHSCNENKFFPVRISSQGKPCFHYRDGFAVYL